MEQVNQDVASQAHRIEKFAQDSLKEKPGERQSEDALHNELELLRKNPEAARQVEQQVREDRLSDPYLPNIKFERDLDGKLSGIEVFSDLFDFDAQFKSARVGHNQAFKSVNKYKDPVCFLPLVDENQVIDFETNDAEKLVEADPYSHAARIDSAVKDALRKESPESIEALHDELMRLRQNPALADQIEDVLFDQYSSTRHVLGNQPTVGFLENDRGQVMGIYFAKGKGDTEAKFSTGELYFDRFKRIDGYVDIKKRDAFGTPYTVSEERSTIAKQWNVDPATAESIKNDVPDSLSRAVLTGMDPNVNRGYRTMRRAAKYFGAAIDQSLSTGRAWAIDEKRAAQDEFGSATAKSQGVEAAKKASANLPFQLRQMTDGMIRMDPAMLKQGLSSIACDAKDITEAAVRDCLNLVRGSETRRASEKAMQNVPYEFFQMAHGISNLDITSLQAGVSSVYADATDARKAIDKDAKSVIDSPPVDRALNLAMPGRFILKKLGL